MQQARQALHDGQTQPQPARLLCAAHGAHACSLVELFENPFVVGRRNADTAVPNLDAVQWLAIQLRALPAGQQHTTLGGVLHRIGQQVAQHTLKQHRVGHRLGLRIADVQSQPQATRFGQRRPFVGQAAQQRGQRHGVPLRHHAAAVHA